MVDEEVPFLWAHRQGSAMYFLGFSAPIQASQLCCRWLTNEKMMWRAAVHEKASQMMVEAVQGALPRKAALDVCPLALLQPLGLMRHAWPRAWLRVHALLRARSP